MLQMVNVLDRFLYGQVNHVEKRKDYITIIKHCQSFLKVHGIKPKTIPL